MASKLPKPTIMKTSDFDLLQNLVIELIKDLNPTFLKDCELAKEITEKTGFYDVIYLNGDFDFTEELNITKYYEPENPEKSDVEVLSRIVHPDYQFHSHEYTSVTNYQGQEDLKRIEFDGFTVLKHSGQVRTKKGLRGFCQIYVQKHGI